MDEEANAMTDDAALREPLQKGRDHLTVSGTFQSDRYPGTPAGKVPLSVRDPLAQDLLWEYARRHRKAAKHGDSEFPKDLEEALRNAGFEPVARGDARDDPEADATDAAHPAWWRGHDHTTAVFCSLVRQILDGEDDGSGVAREPWESLRRRLLQLARARANTGDRG